MVVSTKQFEETANGELERRVLATLTARNFPGLRRLIVQADGGVVTIAGRVRTFYEKQLAQHLARHVAGVIRVRMRFRSSSRLDRQPDGDGRFADRLSAAFQDRFSAQRRRSSHGPFHGHIALRVEAWAVAFGRLQSHAGGSVAGISGRRPGLLRRPAYGRSAVVFHPQGGGPKAPRRPATPTKTESSD